MADQNVEFAVQLYLEDGSRKTAESNALTELSKKRTIIQDDDDDEEEEGDKSNVDDPYHDGHGQSSKERGKMDSWPSKSKSRSPPAIDLTKEDEVESEPGSSSFHAAFSSLPSSSRRNVFTAPLSNATSSSSTPLSHPGLSPALASSESTNAWQIGTTATARSSATMEAFRDFASDSEFLVNLNHSDTPALLARPERLSDLFRPPLDIIYRGSFDEARNIARIQNRWLLVNLQDTTEFACQMLNRDLWREADVKAFIKEHFIFCQLAADSSQGTRYKNYYPVQSYPHYALLDPRTGERVKVWHAILKPFVFIQEGKQEPLPRAQKCPCAFIPECARTRALASTRTHSALNVDMAYNVDDIDAC